VGVKESGNDPYELLPYLSLESWECLTLIMKSSPRGFKVGPELSNLWKILGNDPYELLPASIPL